MLRFTFVVLFVVGTALSGSVARAGQPSVDSLIQQGLALRREGKSQEALEQFKRAHALAPSPRTFGQMGLVEASLERWVDAENHLSVALTNSADGWVSKNRAFLNSALALSRQHLGDLIVTGPAGTEIAIGGKPVGTLPAVPALRLAEGTVVATADAPGFRPFEQKVTIQAGARTPLTIVLAPLPATVATKPDVTKPPADGDEPPKPPIAHPPIPDRPPEEPSHWHKWAGAAIAVAGAGAVGLGIAWIALDGRPTCDMCISLYNTKTQGIIVTAVGAAAIAGGVVLFFTPNADDNKPHLALGVAPGSLLFSGRF